MKDLYSRIDLDIELDVVSRNICNDYNIGNFISSNVINFGYEDFNYILNTSDGKYYVKIFNKNRSIKDCSSYIDRIKLSNKIGINSPKLYSFNNNYIYTFKNNRLCLMEYIEGNNYAELNISPSDDDIREIIKQIAIIHNYKLKSDYIYDPWTLINYNIEFDNKKEYLYTEDLDRLTILRNKYNDINFSKLTYSFVHGDISYYNTIKDKNNKLWIVDFASSNNLPRIVDLVEFICDFCTDFSNINQTKRRIKLVITEYEKHHKLTTYEKEIFPLFFELANGIGIIQTSYQDRIDNNSNENNYWLDISRKGLNISSDELWKDIFHK